MNVNVQAWSTVNKPTHEKCLLKSCQPQNVGHTDTLKQYPFLLIVNNQVHT